MKPLRVSARALAEFTFFGQDIVPVSPALMQMGQRGHAARQSASGMERERTLSWQGESAGLSFYVSGRADLLGHDPLAVEEIKLCVGEAPRAPLPAHRAQAVIYAFMAMAAGGQAAAHVAVRYVRENGGTAACFEETVPRPQAEAEFFALLDAYAADAAETLRRRALRDQSLQALAFPYPEYRAGQRDMAAQVYTAIARKKRLFADVPTGSGKSVSVLYPALKALSRQLTPQVFFLTARTTGRRAALGEMARMQRQGARVSAVALTAREKCCPMDEMRCDPAFCPRAKGHFLRAREALRQEKERLFWDESAIRQTADRHALCPFEFSLALAAKADAVICDYNYAFDPLMRLERVFDAGVRPTLLMDEAHQLEGRIRDALSLLADMDTLTLWRREAGRMLTRSAPCYRALTGFKRALAGLQGMEGLPALLDAAQAAWDQAKHHPLSFKRALYRALFLLRRAAENPADYALGLAGGEKNRAARLTCLHITGYIREATRSMSGCVYFSATLRPLAAMKALLGGEGEDACFALPSPFPMENCLTVHMPVDTRYRQREATLLQVAGAVRALYRSRPGHYLVCFPSYRYLRQAAGALADLPLHVQREGMREDERAAYLSRFFEDGDGVVGLCVLGGAFSESVDFKGEALIGVAVVGVGLKTVDEESERLKRHYEESLGSGFDYAYRYPGVHKVLQAAGRLIRTREDKGVVLLLDARWGQRDYQSLLPPHLRPVFARDTAALQRLLQDFYALHGI